MAGLYDLIFDFENYKEIIMNIKILRVAAVVAIMATGSASASTFSFSGNGGILGSSSGFVSNDNALSLTATATRQDNNGNPISGTALLGQYPGGLGVTTSRYDNHQVDSFGPEEAVLFDFGHQAVTLKSVTFSFVDWNDDFSFSFFTNDVTNPDNFFKNISLPNSGSLQTYTFLNTWTGNLFGIGAAGAFLDSGDNFKIHSLEVAAVPLPAAAFLFAPALLGFIGLRRKAQKTVA
jgi:hypothetical protein